MKRKINFVSFFILLTHVIPAWLARKGPMDIIGTELIFIIYLLSLWLQGTDAITVYRQVLDEPPLTIKEYLKTRRIL